VRDVCGMFLLKCRRKKRIAELNAKKHYDNLSWLLGEQFTFCFRCHVWHQTAVILKFRIKISFSRRIICMNLMYFLTHISNITSNIPHL